MAMVSWASIGPLRRTCRLDLPRPRQLLRIVALKLAYGSSLRSCVPRPHLPANLAVLRRSWHLQEVVSFLGCPGFFGPIPSAGLDESAARIGSPEDLCQETTVEVAGSGRILARILELDVGHPLPELGVGEGLDLLDDLRCSRRDCRGRNRSSRKPSEPARSPGACRRSRGRRPPGNSRWRARSGFRSRRHRRCRKSGTRRRAGSRAPLPAAERGAGPDCPRSPASRPPGRLTHGRCSGSGRPSRSGRVPRGRL